MIATSSVADPGCLFRLPDPNFFHPGSRIRIKKFKYFNPQNCFQALGKMIRVEFIPDPDPDFLPIPDPGVKKKTPDPGSGTATLVPGETMHSPDHFFLPKAV
jgi:hypothetical protein